MVVRTTGNNSGVQLTPSLTPPHPSARARVYRSTAPGGSSSTWATREIAALDFLLGIPLENERSIVRAGLNGSDAVRGRRVSTASEENEGLYSVSEEDTMQRLQCREASTVLTKRRNEEGLGGSSIAPVSTVPSMKGEEKADIEPLTSAPQPAPQPLSSRWWDKLILKDKGFFFAENQKARRRARIELEEKELERPTGIAASAPDTGTHVNTDTAQTNIRHPPIFAATPTIAAAPGSLSATDHDMVSPTSGLNHAPQRVAPGRRLDGRDAVTITIPREIFGLESKTRQRTVARQAAVREWEFQVAHGIGNNKNSASNNNRGLLDGRAFFSQKGSYPIGVFSVIKYEPKKEEAERKRKIVERLGRGGTDFVMPERDWRGISYRALLPRVEKKNRAFNRLIATSKRKIKPNASDKLSADSYSSFKGDCKFKHFSHSTSQNTMYSETTAATKISDEANPVHSSTNDDDSTEEEDDNETISTSSSEESDSYVPGFLDDPEMLQGRHRHVMVGDKVTGCVVLSVIQFVQPAELKADLNKQFRERFDGWEPPKSQRKFIGAKVIDGVYTLMDPTEATASQEVIDSDEEENARLHRKRSISVEMIRMPPSLTLSKIRSLKQQALMACVNAKLEISTVALACVYFERLCLDCRVDKVNRRLSFAACLLLAAKTNEANIAIVHGQGKETKRGVRQMKSWIKPTNKSSNIFASLLEFFTHDWSCSLKHLFDAEWGVFAALGFRLHATPAQVAFHFKRLMKALEWAPLSYLGHEMYKQWQDSLIEEVRQRDRHEERKELRRNRQERKLMKLQRELHIQQTEEVSKRGYSAPEIPDDPKQWGSEDYANNVQQNTGTKLQNQNAKSRQNLVQSEARIRRVSPLRAEQTSISKLGSIALLNRLGIKKIHRTLSAEKNLNRIQSSSGISETMQRSVSSPHVRSTTDIVIDISEEVMVGEGQMNRDNLCADDLDFQGNSDSGASDVLSF